MQLIRLLQVPMRILQVELCGLLIDVQTCHTAITNTTQRTRPTPDTLLQSLSPQLFGFCSKKGQHECDVCFMQTSHCANATAAQSTDCTVNASTKR